MEDSHCDNALGQGYVVRSTQDFMLRNTTIRDTASGGTPFNVTPENLTGAVIDGLAITASSGSYAQDFIYGGSAPGVGVIRGLRMSGRTDVNPFMNANVGFADWIQADGKHYTRVAGVGSVADSSFAFFNPAAPPAPNKIACTRNGGGQLGQCSTAPDASGSCTCQ